MVRNTASMQSLRNSIANCSLSFPSAEDHTPGTSELQQPQQPQQRQHQSPLQRLDGPSMQLCGHDDYTKTLMTKIATGQATESEQAAFNSHVNQSRSLPSFQNLLHQSNERSQPVSIAHSLETGNAFGGDQARLKPNAFQEAISKGHEPEHVLDKGSAPAVAAGFSCLPLVNPGEQQIKERILKAQQEISLYKMRPLMARQEQGQTEEQRQTLQSRGDRTFQDCQKALLILEQEFEKLRSAGFQEQDSTLRNYALQDCHMRTIVLDQQFEKLRGLLGFEPDIATRHRALQEFQLQIQLVEQEKEKRRLRGSDLDAVARNHALRDHEIQMMLLEQQNGRRSPRHGGRDDIQVACALQKEPFAPQDGETTPQSSQEAKKQIFVARDESEVEDANRRRLLMIEHEQTKMHYGTPDSTWERERNRLLDVHPQDWQPNEKAQFERFWRSYLLKQKVQRRKSRGLAATLAANNEANRFKQSTRENAAKYTKPFCDFLTENPTVFHCVDTLKGQLKDAGFTELSERNPWTIKPSGSYYVERNGSSLIAFTVGAKYEPGNGAAILAGHIDALTAKLKPISQVPNKAGYLQLGVAPYAGALNKTWWDRDLGIGGRVHIKDGDKIVSKLVKLDWPIARIPSLAEHFGAPADGPFNKETQMVPIIGLGTTESSSGPFAPVDPYSQPPLLGGLNGPVGSFVNTQPPALVKAIYEQLNLKSGSSTPIVNWELELFDVQPATVGGLNKEFIFAGRIDDKLCSWAALQALLESQKYDTEHSSLIKVVGLFDDEEIGSLLRQGAKGNFLPSTIERAVGSLADHHPTSDLMGRTYANSFMVSSDVTHAVNPNFLDVYLANHAPHLNVGVAVAADSNGHMTTDSVSTAILKRCADKVGAQLQVFQIRNDSRSGGTVGPMLSSAMGVRAIDAGLAQLSMHSIRATTGALDPGLGVLMFVGFLNGFESVDQEFR